jgi:hypothetical protein
VYDGGVPDYRLPPSMREDSRLLDAIHESIVGSNDFAGDVELPGTTGGQRAVVALQLVDALVGDGGFEAVTESRRDLLEAAREASEVVGAPEHRSLLESRDTEQWLSLEGLLRDRLLAYVGSNEEEFFVDSDEAAATAARVRAHFDRWDEWYERTVEEIKRQSAAQEWLVDRFGDRGVYTEDSTVLLLRPDDMRQALEAAADAGYQARELVFLADVDGRANWETIEADPSSDLDAGIARHAAAWVGVVLDE